MLWNWLDIWYCDSCVMTENVVPQIDDREGRWASLSMAAQDAPVSSNSTGVQMELEISEYVIK